MDLLLSTVVFSTANSGEYASKIGHKFLDHPVERCGEIECLSRCTIRALEGDIRELLRCHQRRQINR